MSCASAVPRKATHLEALSILADCLEIESPSPLNRETDLPLGPTGFAAIPTLTSSLA